MCSQLFIRGSICQLGLELELEIMLLSYFEEHVTRFSVKKLSLQLFLKGRMGVTKEGLNLLFWYQKYILSRVTDQNKVFTVIFSR